MKRILLTILYIKLIKKLLGFCRKLLVKSLHYQLSIIMKQSIPSDAKYPLISSCRHLLRFSKAGGWGPSANPYIPLPPPPFSSIIEFYDHYSQRRLMADAPQETPLDEMLDKLAHDLRGQLASIMGYAEIILETAEEGHDLPEDVLISAKAIRECSIQMLARIDEIKNFHSRPSP